MYHLKHVKNVCRIVNCTTCLKTLFLSGIFCNSCSCIVFVTGIFLGTTITTFFSQDLSRISYNAPRMAAEAVQEIRGDNTDIRILNLGAGTGLDAVEVRTAASLQWYISTSTSIKLTRFVKSQSQMTSYVHVRFLSFSRNVNEQSISEVERHCTCM